MNAGNYYNCKDDIWSKDLSIVSRLLYNIRDKRADWAQSRDERCVNRVYRATRQLMGEELLRQSLKNFGKSY